MKKEIISLLTLLLFVISGLAQNEMKPERNDKINALRVAFLTEKMDLNSEESAKFWPIYNQRKKELESLRKEYRPAKRPERMNEEEALAFMEEKWEEMLPQYPFDYTYVEENIDNMYRGEERMSTLLKIFTVVAMIIASLGLFALASFTAQRRTKEIGIRKTMGANEGQITRMMIRDFSLYILISLIIALPAVWFIARSWLNQFAFRIELEAGLFLITALITTTVAILRVLYHAFRTARTNPVLALRYE